MSLNNPRVLRLASKPASLSDPPVSTISMFIHMDWNPNFSNLQHKHFIDYSSPSHPYVNTVYIKELQKS